MNTIRVSQCRRATKYAKEEGYENIPAWSRGAKPWRELSPFFIGPVCFIDENGKENTATIFENFWRAHKVYDVDSNDMPTNLFYEKRDKIMKSVDVVPKVKKIQKYAFFNGEKLDLIQSRKKIYIAFLQKCYRKHKVYQLLLEKYKSNNKLMIIE